MGKHRRVLWSCEGVLQLVLLRYRNSYRPVSGGLVTYLHVRTSTAVFAFIDFFMTTVLVAFRILEVPKPERLSVQTAHDAARNEPEGFGAVWILPIPFSFALFRTSGILCIFAFCAVRSTDNCYRIRIPHQLPDIPDSFGSSYGFFHQQNKTVYVETVMVHVHYRYLFVRYVYLDIMRQPQLTIIYVVTLYIHGCSR